MKLYQVKYTEKNVNFGEVEQWFLDRAEARSFAKEHNGTVWLTTISKPTREVVCRWLNNDGSMEQYIGESEQI